MFGIDFNILELKFGLIVNCGAIVARACPAPSSRKDFLVTPFLFPSVFKKDLLLRLRMSF